ncbi:MAG: hypothetical protein HYS08_10820, partial [Chlamydiae bacterium]|nr:hypothetical protein [Chlamydiota bacterium]
MGGSIQTLTKRADGKLQSDSTVTFTSSGNPSVSDTINYAKDGTTVTTTARTDFSKALFDDQNNIVGGSIQTLTKRADGKLQSDSTVTFASSGNPSVSDTINYAKDGTTVTTTARTDFSKALFDDENNIVGGSIQTLTKRADGKLQSDSTVTFSTSGNPSVSDTTNYAKDGTTVTTTARTDFSKALFDDQNNIVGGSIQTLTKRADGKLQSDSTVTFTSSGNPSVSDTINYAKDGTTVTTTARTDFSKALFDDQNNIVGGSIQTLTKRADGKLQSDSTVTFSTSGNP